MPFLHAVTAAVRYAVTAGWRNTDTMEILMPLVAKSA